jgi:hypothetical protein
VPNKIEISLSNIIDLENVYGDDRSLLVFSDLVVVNENLNVISNSMWEFTRLKYIMNPTEYLYLTPLCTGCTMLFNHVAKLSALNFSRLALMHDSLVALSVLASNGKISVIDSSLVYYRQHGDNFFGTSAFNNSFFSRVLNFRESLKSMYKYYCFVNSVVGISPARYLFLKVKAALKIRNLI